MSLPTAITINPDIICQELDGQTVLLNPLTGSYFGLDQVSGFIWQLLQDMETVDDVLACMDEVFDTNRQQLQQDLKMFLEQLAASELISLEPSQ